MNSKVGKRKRRKFGAAFKAKVALAALREDNRKRVMRLMRLMDITALYRKPGTSKRNPGRKVFPYLLRELPVERARQVYALDTTYIPMREGFVYLTAVIDWASRKVLAHKVAITLEACHAVEVLEEAISRFGAPEITPTRAVSSRPARSLTWSWLPGRSCRWTAGGPGATTCLPSGYGRVRSTRRYSCTPTRRSLTPRPAPSLRRVLQHRATAQQPR